jgi:hypothetical protein
MIPIYFKVELTYIFFMRKILLLLLPFFLLTCGGGGGSTEPEPPQLPTVSNIEVTTLEDTAKTFALTGTDPNNLALTYSISTQPQHGTISISGGAATYSPNANYHGQDVIAYLASSTSGNSNIGTIIITITPVDDEPNTMDVTATTDEDNSVSLTLEAEEYDGENIEFQVKNNPSNGSVNISGTTATYIPNENWNGTDQFNFEAIDSSSKRILNIATGTIVVNPINDLPRSISNLGTEQDPIEVKRGENLNFTMSGWDVDQDTLSFSIKDYPQKGQISLNDNSLYQNNQQTSINGIYYTNENSLIGSDSFTYTASDNEGESQDIGTAYFSIYSLIGFNQSDVIMKIFSDNNSYILIGQKYGCSEENFQLIQIDQNGNMELDQGYNNNEIDCVVVESVIEYDEGFLISGGTFDNTGFVVKLDSQFNEEWFQTFGDLGPGGTVKSVISRNDGGLLIGGKLDYESFLSKFDSQGNREWIITYTKQESLNMDVRSIVHHNNGGYLIGGQLTSSVKGHTAYIMHVDDDGNEVWFKDLDLFSSDNYFGTLDRTSDGGYIIGMMTDVHSAGKGQICLVKIDDDGNVEWNQCYENNFNDNWLNDLALTNDGGFVLAGFRIKDSYDQDYKILKVDSSGNVEWLKYFGRTWADEAYTVHEDNNGDLIIGGRAHDGQSHIMYVIKLDADGNQIF